jgi:hypothetical protein
MGHFNDQIPLGLGLPAPEVVKQGSHENPGYHPENWQEP